MSIPSSTGRLLIPTTIRARPHDVRLAFTVVELTLVLLLLSILALATATVVDRFQDQQRYQQTKHRLEKIRTAIFAPVGNPGTQMSPTGFAADIGRAPHTIGELLDGGRLPRWHFDPSAGQWAGWRGPYLTTLPEQDGQLAFRDGWGTAGSAPDFGWQLRSSATGEWWVQSLGKDGLPGGAGYFADYPSRPLLQADDLVQDLQGWSIQVRLENGSPSPFPHEDCQLRLFVHYPREGRLDWAVDWPPDPARRDSASFLSLGVPLRQAEIPAAGSIERVFVFGTGEKRVPCGVRSLSLLRDDTGAPVRSIPATHSVVLLPRSQLAPWSLTFRLEEDEHVPAITAATRVQRRPRGLSDSAGLRAIRVRDTGDDLHRPRFGKRP